MEKNKEILIVGGTGFIGFHLAKCCLSKGLSVTSLSTKYPKKNRKLKHVKYIKCDLFNKKKLRKLIRKNYNFVVNLGGYVDHSNKIKTYNSHYIGCKIFKYFCKKYYKLCSMGSQVNMVSFLHLIMKNLLTPTLFMEVKILSNKISIKFT